MNPDGYIGGWTININAKYYNYSTDNFLNGVGVGETTSTFEIPRFNLSIKKPISQILTVGMDLSYSKYELSLPPAYYYKNVNEQFMLYRQSWINKNFELGFNATFYLR
jgi:hypothetical protein